MASDPKIVAKWLTGIGLLVGGNATEADASAKIRAYTALLAPDYPPEAFGGRSLKAFAAKCRFFPAYAECVTHLDAFCATLRANSTKPVSDWTDQDWLNQALSVTGKPSLVRVFLQHQPGALALYQASQKALEGPACDPAYAAAAVDTALRNMALVSTRKSA